MTAAQLSAFVIMAETLPRLIQQEEAIIKEIEKKNEAIEEASEGRDYTDAENELLDQYGLDRERAENNARDLEDIQDGIECLLDGERKNPR